MKKKIPKPKRNQMRKYVFFALLAIVIAAFFVSVFGYFQTFSEEDVIINVLEYSDEFEDGQITDWESFCDTCGDDCNQRVDFQIAFPRFEQWENFPFEREYHCVKIVDGV
ncbi:hypothetical protein KA005_30570, partial [bacterium]|nr:hypothetical protein [bacterium]